MFIEVLISIENALNVQLDMENRQTLDNSEKANKNS